MCVAEPMENLALLLHNYNKFIDGFVYNILSACKNSGSVDNNKQH